MNLETYATLKALSNKGERLRSQIVNGDRGIRKYFATMLDSLPDDIRNQPEIPVREIESIPDPGIVRTEGNFYVVNAHGNYAVMKPRISTVLSEKTEALLGRLKKHLESSAGFPVDFAKHVYDAEKRRRNKPENWEEEAEEILSLYERIKRGGEEEGVLVKAPLSKSQLLNIFYQTVKGNKVAEEDFRLLTDMKFTKSSLLSLPFEKVLELDRKIGTFALSPYFDGGYSFKEERRYRLSRSFDVVSTIHEIKDRKERELCLSLARDIEESESAVATLVGENESVDIDKLSKELEIDARLRSRLAEIEERTGGLTPEDFAVEGKNVTRFFSEANSVEFDCKPSTAPSLLQTSIDRRALLRAAPKMFKEGSEWNRESSVIYYGAQKDVRHAMLVVEQQKEIFDDLKKKRGLKNELKKGEGRKMGKQGFLGL